MSVRSESAQNVRKAKGVVSAPTTPRPARIPETTASGALLYSINETAATLGISRVTLYEEINKGKLRVRKIGRRSLVESSSLRDYVASLPTL